MSTSTLPPLGAHSAPSPPIPISVTHDNTTTLSLFQVFAPRSNPRFHGETIDGEGKDERGKLNKDAATKHGPLTQALFDQHHGGRIRLGVAPLLDDGSCRWGCIDIDGKDGRYTDFESELLAILKKVEDYNTGLLPVRSRSRGLHLYVFCDPASDAASMLAMLREIITDLGLPATTETRPASVAPATPEQIAKEEGDCSGGWLHLPYCGNDLLTRGAALNWDGSEMTEEQFLVAIAEREFQNKVALQALRILKSKPKKAYEYPLTDGNCFNGVKSSIGAFVQNNPSIQIDDLIAWANSDLRASMEVPVDDKWWNSLKIPNLCRKVLAQQAAQQPMSTMQKRNYSRLVKLAITMVRAGDRSDAEILERVLAKNERDAERIDPRAAEAAYFAAMEEIQDKGEDAGRPVKAHPIYLAEQKIREHYDLARDAAFRPYHYDETRHTWVLDTFPFEEILKVEYERDKAVPKMQDGLTLQWNLARGNSVAFWKDPPLDRINLQNGILDINTLILQPHSEKSKEFLFPNQFQVPWDPAALCPTWDKVAVDILGEHEAIVVSEILGYLMIPDLDMQKAFLFQGVGGNGKSIILDVYDLILGKSNCASVSFQDIESNRFSLVNLVGKLANIDADMSSRRIPGSQKFKKITSGLDRVDIEQKYREIQTGVRLYTRLLFSCNQFPRCDDNTEGFWSRWIVLKFCRKFFRKGQRDESEGILPQKLIPLLMFEAPGIVRKAIESYKAVRERGHFTETDDMREWFQEFKFNTDSLSVWLNEQTVCAEGCTVIQQDLRKAYNVYCESKDIAPLGPDAFAERVLEVRPGVMSGKNAHNDAIFIGLGRLVDSAVPF